MIGSFVPEKEVAQLYNLVLECEKDTKAAHAMECVYGAKAGEWAVIFAACGARFCEFRYHQAEQKKRLGQYGKEVVETCLFTSLQKIPITSIIKVDLDDCVEVDLGDCVSD